MAQPTRHQSVAICIKVLFTAIKNRDRLGRGPTPTLHKASPESSADRRAGVEVKLREEILWIDSVAGAPVRVGQDLRPIDDVETTLLRLRPMDATLSTR
jgi:hypothetical protein